MESLGKVDAVGFSTVHVILCFGYFPISLSGQQAVNRGQEEALESLKDLHPSPCGPVVSKSHGPAKKRVTDRWPSMPSWTLFIEGDRRRAPPGQGLPADQSSHGRAADDLAARHGRGTAGRGAKAKSLEMKEMES